MARSCSLLRFPAALLSVLCATGCAASGAGSDPMADAGPTRLALDSALIWIAEHQTLQGYWSATEFSKEDVLEDMPHSDGPGNPFNDVGVTGLALLALLGDGHTASEGAHAGAVGDALEWLLENQQPDGLIGSEVGHSTLYNHAIATAALAEAVLRHPYHEDLPVAVGRAVALIRHAQNRDGGWRYSLRPGGQSDTIVTGWMVAALRTAREAGAAVESGTLYAALAWLDGMTDPETGRTAYAGPGITPTRASRVPASRVAQSEAPTAVALLCNLITGKSSEMRSLESHPRHALLAKQVSRLLLHLPQWGPEGEFYYWSWATFALAEWGGPAWETWAPAMERTLVEHQRTDGNCLGSWDPVGPWGEDGGRVYSTALAAMMLEVVEGRSELLQKPRG